MAKRITRRSFLKKSALGLAALGSAGFAGGGRRISAPHVKNSKISDRMIIIGIDGMDPKFLHRFIESGDMPNFKKLMEKGYYSKLQTTMPPQTPVAWASFITGTDPGGNGIFDFIHRDPSKFLPYLSTSRSYDSEKKINLGKYSIPLDSGRVELMRRGRAFWSVLDEYDVPATVFQIPSAFPVEEDSRSRIVSGAGTPDLLGSYGTATVLSERGESGKDSSSSRTVVAKPVNHEFVFKINGPANSFRTDNAVTESEVRVQRDPTEPTVRIKVSDQEVILKQGEWSDWLPLRFALLEPLMAMQGMVRIFVKEVHPYFKAYVSPINIDPTEPILPISSPSDFAAEIAKKVGRYYTQGFPADTKSLSHALLSDEEYFQQARIVLEENERALDYLLNDHDDGLLYFYFSNLDQNTHMFWRLMDETHPQYEPNASPEMKGAIKFFYKRMDEALGRVMAKVNNYTTLMVLSDHGFVPFTREFHASTWLTENGYTKFFNPKKMEEAKFFSGVDWSRTKAYALGLNGIYINLKGREKNGIVSAAEAKALKRELIQKLSELTDPQTGQKLCVGVYDSEDIYSEAHRELAPDIMVGYSSGYRISDPGAFGEFPRGAFGDRTDKWSADHCLDPSLVPGVLLTNREITLKDPGLWDMAPSILQCFSIKAPPEMTGKPIFKA